jgi:NADH:ubiquinone oxidoreductase subunit E
MGQAAQASWRARQPLVLGGFSALVVLVCVAWLAADYLAERRGAAEAGLRIERLEERTRVDPAAAEQLHAERERQTSRLLARKARATRIGWVLLVAGGLFVGCGKQWLARRPQPAPSLESLVRERFPAPPARRGRPKREGETAVVPAAEGGLDLSFVDDQIRRLGRGREAAIPLLQAIQSHFRYLPDEALRHVCERTEITPAQIAGTSSFYAQFRRSPVGRHLVRVCHGTACHVAGADAITQELRRHLGIREGEDTDDARRFTVDQVACVGCCSLAPVMMVEEETAGRLTPASARRVLDELGGSA